MEYKRRSMQRSSHRLDKHRVHEWQLQSRHHMRLQWDYLPHYPSNFAPDLLIQSSSRFSLERKIASMESDSSTLSQVYSSWKETNYSTQWCYENYIQVLPRWVVYHELVLTTKEYMRQVGDPLEKAALKGIEWSYKSDEKAMPKKGGGNAVQIVQRHHFASHLKRMAVVVRAL
ncbi:putative manganese-transporting ATPase PDR2 [Camellia lanceoleosa]|uniref:Manganese-transporting ATPase PDR2 n=1 Tax=Camellia lanceoleosa TaxID=1840588 RepID=A0ACC0IT96_9ERIC|nr:putative manganese-transporting ATPase PDR2 [Camellia lanceoleosa]